VGLLGSQTRRERGDPAVITCRGETRKREEKGRGVAFLLRRSGSREQVSQSCRSTIREREEKRGGKEKEWGGLVITSTFRWR